MLDKTDLKEIQKLLDPIQKNQKKHGKLLESLKKDQDVMLNMLDKEQMNQRKRLQVVEEHLGISTRLD